MTKKEKSEIVNMIKKLEKLAVKADVLNLVLPNGGLISNMLGGIAEDLKLYGPQR